MFLVFLTGTNYIGLRAYYYLENNDKIYNVYFAGVGAGRRGSGDLWITQVPHYLPFIEHQVVYESSIPERFK